MARVGQAPNLEREGRVMGLASHTTRALVTLAEALAEHEFTSLDALSGRVLGKGGFFDRLKNGGDCRTATAERVLLWFDAVWPDDLPWASDAPRPSLRGAFGQARSDGAAPALPEPDDAFLARLAHLPIWPSGRRPSWWDDMEVRGFLTRSHRQMSTLKAARIGTRKFGDRCPKKSAIHNYWQRLDKVMAAPALKRGIA
jgi:hypothetical protein